MNTLKISALSLAITATILAIVYLFVSNLPTVEGSVAQGNDYRSFSLAASNTYGASTTAGTIKTGFGSLGSVVITGAAAGVINFYDATTTNALARSESQSTSSILIASIPASLAAGTYVFDVAFSRGLTFDLSGTAPTTTITLR